MKTLALAGFIALALSPNAANAASMQSAGPTVLELLGIIPAPTYDPYTSPIIRRRPGYPAEPPGQFEIKNPDAVDPAPVDQVGEFVPLPDRWRIMETLGFKYPWYDPYNQNVYKADKPISFGEHGEKRFLNLNFISDTVLEPRGIPTPVAPQAPGDAGENDVLGGTDQVIWNENLIASATYYQGNTTFKPPDWEWKATLVFNYNRVDTDETRALQIDPRKGESRDDGFLGVQELFYTK